MVKNKQIKEKFERIVNFSPAYDKRHPEPSKNYGISATRIWFILKGKKGAVQVMIGTDWYLPETVEEYKRIGNENKTEPTNLRDKEEFLDCWDVGYHSFKPLREWQNKDNSTPCELHEQGHCWYDGSSLRGQEDKVGRILLEKGSDGIWEYLENYYKEVFN